MSTSKLSGANLSCSDYVPDAVKININKQVNPSKQSTLEFKTSLSSTENTVDRPRHSLRLDATAATNVSAASYDGKVDLKDSLTANCTLLDWPKIFVSLAAEVSSSTVPAESFCHPRQGPFRVVESASGLVVVNRRDIRLIYVEKDHYIDTAPPVPPTQDFIFDDDCSFTTKCLQKIDVNRVIRRIRDNLKEHRGERASVAHPDNGPFSIL